MNKIELLKKSRRIANVIDQIIDGAQISSEHKYMVAGGCFDVVLEHQKAVTSLIGERLFGSAFSLMRPLFETFIRGLWVLYQADGKEIEKFLKDKVELSVTQIIESIEKTPGFDIGVLSEIKKTSYVSMCSYTHGGWLQIGRRFRGEYIESTYSYEEIEEVINFSNTVAMLAAHEIAKMSKNRETVIAIKNVYLENT